MIKTYNLGYESFECSKCGADCNEYDDYCQICGHTFIKINYNTLHAFPNKFKAIDFVKGEFNNQQVLIATLINSLIGEEQFIVPVNSQISMRVQSYVISGINDFLEDGLIDDRLIVLDDFTQLMMNDIMYYVDKRLLK